MSKDQKKYDTTYGVVIYVHMQAGKVHVVEVGDGSMTRREESRLRKIIKRQIKAAPIAQRPKPSLGWTNTITAHLDAQQDRPIDLSCGSANHVVALVLSGEMLLLQGASMGLLKYLGHRHVLVVEDSVGYRYIKLPGTPDEVLARLHAEGVWGLAAHALGKTPAGD